MIHLGLYYINTKSLAVMKAITQPIIDFGLARVVGGPPKHNSLEEIDFVRDIHTVERGTFSFSKIHEEGVIFLKFTNLPAAGKKDEIM